MQENFLHPVPNDTSTLLEEPMTPEEMVARVELPAKHIADIELEFGAEPLPCGFPSFEKYMYLRRGQSDVVTIAARPGQGKTILGLQVALNTAKHMPVCFFSLEMTKDQLKKRILSQITKRSAKQLAHPQNKPLVDAANEQLRNTALFLDDTSGLDANSICNRAHTFARKRGLGLVVIDYVQIVAVPEGELKAEGVAKTMSTLKKLAKELNVPVLILAQLNREFEKRLADNPEAKPISSDLADSSSIEKWSDILLTIHQPHPHTISVTALKNRHGEKVDLTLDFSGELMTLIDRGEAGL